MLKRLSYYYMSNIVATLHDVVYICNMFVLFVLDMRHKILLKNIQI